MTLGIKYIKGEFVPQDFVEAYMWLLLAAKQGHKNADIMRERLAKKMTSQQINQAITSAEDWQPQEIMGAPP